MNNGNILRFGRGWPFPPTNVANAYGHYIFVKVVGDPIQITELTIPQRGIKATTNYATEQGFTRIAPRSHFKFDAPCQQGTVYVSIFAADGREICRGEKILHNGSLIVDRGGYIKQTKAGAMWTDEDGNEY